MGGGEYEVFQSALNDYSFSPPPALAGPHFAVMDHWKMLHSHLLGQKEREKASEKKNVRENYLEKHSLFSPKNPLALSITHLT